LIARAIHDRSRREQRTLVKLNCAAIPTGLLESELFGHEKGAFTGAINQKIGRLELADQGTLFLDEVGDIPIEIQPKLLRALQEREFERLGSTHTRKVNVRVVAATNRDLDKMVVNKEFRSDLYYRLNVFPIRIPPLRDRRDDIPLLASYFVQKFAKEMQKSIEAVPAAVMKGLTAWDWPGNIRELENFIERAVLLTRGKSLEAPLAELRRTNNDEFPDANVHEFKKVAAETDSRTAKSSVADEYERKQRDEIVRALAACNGRVGGIDGAAARLGMNRTTLLSRMKKFGIYAKQYACSAACLFLVASPNSFDSFDPFNFFNSNTFDFRRSSPENSATYGSAGLVWALPLSLVVESKSAETSGGDNGAVSLDLLIASYGIPAPDRTERYRTSELSSLSDLQSPFYECGVT
jgi:formate hydrogenlyase transcriptional activator